MKFLDLFSGIGGFRLGMEMNGHECVGHCEIDKYADKSYRAMHDVKENEYYANDIRGIIPSELPDFDCICGGFPCQSFSIAGKRGGFEDTRGTLFFEIARIIQERKPRLVFLENVAGLLSHDDGSTFETIIGTLDELGYDVEWQVCNSKDFGVPQNRERVFIIGHIRGSCRRTVFPIRGQSCKPLVQVGQLYGTEIEPNPQAGRIYSPDGISPTMDTCQGGNRMPKIAIECYDFSQSGREGGPRIYNDICPTLGARDYKEPRCVKINCLNTKNQDGVQPHQHERVYHTDGLLPALNAEINGRNNIAIPVLTPDRSKKRQNGRRFKENGDVMFTLTAQDKHGVMVNEATIQNYRIRKLTPLECFRLQGFPDELFYKAKAVNSDSQLYKQAGNSVTVNVIYEIAKKF